VAYVLEQNKSIAGAARESGIGETTLGNWIAASFATGCARVLASELGQRHDEQAEVIHRQPAPSPKHAFLTVVTASRAMAAGTDPSPHGPLDELPRSV
jgi:hypothetical protein